MKYAIIAGIACLAVTGCSAAGPAAGQGLFAMAAALDGAEKAALIYQQSSTANPATVARIKDLDANAYAVIGPMAAAGGAPSATDLATAQAALVALTAYLAQNGVK